MLGGGGGLVLGFCLAWFFLGAGDLLLFFFLLR